MSKLAVAIIAIVTLAQTANAGILDGRWRQGSWTDDNTRHEGPLRARFREDHNGNYRVAFSGRFAKIVPFRFATTLNVVGHDGDKVIMSGTSRIFGFGNFTYDAVADGSAFNSHYSSRRWTGTFSLNR